MEGAESHTQAILSGVAYQNECGPLKIGCMVFIQQDRVYNINAITITYHNRLDNAISQYLTILSKGIFSKLNVPMSTA
jgi:hypothetical protein